MRYRLNCPDGFSPQREAAEQALSRSLQTPECNLGDKSPKGPVTCRRQKSFNKCRHPSMTSEYIDELTIIGYNEIPEVTTIFETTGQFYVHRSCALWSHGVTRTGISMLFVKISQFYWVVFCFRKYGIGECWANCSTKFIKKVFFL